MEDKLRAGVFSNAVAKCYTCDTDGCNAADRFGPIVLLIGFSVAIARIFLLQLVVLRLMGLIRVTMNFEITALYRIS